MSVTDELLSHAERYAEAFDSGELPMPPAKRVAVVACMDARLNPYGLSQRQLLGSEPLRSRTTNTKAPSPTVQLAHSSST